MPATLVSKKWRRQRRCRNGSILNQVGTINSRNSLLCSVTNVPMSYLKLKWVTLHLKEMAIHSFAIHLQGLQAQSWIFDLLITGWKIANFYNLWPVFKSLQKHNSHGAISEVIRWPGSCKIKDGQKLWISIFKFFPNAKFWI